MKRKVEAEKENAERWVLTYADLITLLAVFFLVLYAMANVDSAKFEKLAGSLASAFQGVGIFAGQSSVKGSTGGEGILARFTSQVEKSVTKGGGQGMTGGGTPSKSAIKQDFQYISNQIDQLVTARGLEDKISVERSAEGIVVNLAGDLLFLTARADLRPEAFFVLDAVAELIRPLPNQLRIEGHTDSVPPVNEVYPTNWHLSGARALAVLQFIEQFGKIPRERMHYTGWADLRPVGSNDTLEGRLQNRRASIVILYPDAAQAEAGSDLSRNVAGAEPALTQGIRIAPIGVLSAPGAQPTGERVGTSP